MPFPNDRGRLPETPELWVGPEASVVRVRDQRCDQLASTGFADDPAHLDRLAALGATRIRLPVLWERAETAPGVHDWSWSDRFLGRLRDAPGPGPMRPVVGLVHHGSGPLHTDLLDPAFPARLAAYAGAVAARYPWVDAWTPVNEPLTTARFSALYGLWYPHASDDASFLRALAHQVLGIRAAMRAIRRHRPDAVLVQTEDLGFTRGTPALAGQVAFDNERRWLSLDLLHGRVQPGHPLWGWLRAAWPDGERVWLDLAADPEPPGVIGINHYVTSDRFLDDRLEHHPGRPAGGNGRQRYVDVEAVRVFGGAPGGFEARLRETLARYGGRVALTEVQLGCTREEQMRWFVEAWQAATTLRREGQDVQAVTAWAVFGAHDWDSLLTQARGHYEPGLFDTRGGRPRPTATAALAAALAAGVDRAGPTLHSLHPVLAAPGWWWRVERLQHPTHPADQPPHARQPSGRPLLITGARGTLGQALARLAQQRGLPYRLLTRPEMDIADPASVAAALARWQPWAVVNAAGFVRVDEAEADADRRRANWRENATGPVVLAAACAREGLPLLTFSSDLVFDGAQCERPYRESDRTRPLSAYGAAKRHAERELAPVAGALVVRSAAFFGPWDGWNFLAQGLAALERGEPWLAIADQQVSPTYVPDLVHASLDLLVDGERGVWHLANALGTARAPSWYELACLAAEGAGLPRAGVRAIGGMESGQRAPRPRYSALASERGAVLPTLERALTRYLDARRRAAADTGPPAPAFGIAA